MEKATVTLALALVCVTATVRANAVLAATDSKWVVGYYAAYQRDMLPPDKIDWKGMTHICVARLLANADGSLDENFDIGAPEGPDLARQLAADARRNGVKSLLMLGGAGAGPEIRAATENHLEKFVANLVAAMDNYGYDGIDLDWEDDENWPVFIAFAKALREAAPDKILTLPVGTININYQTVEPAIVTLSQWVDQVNVMSYYPGCAVAGNGWRSWHNCPLDGAKATTPVSIADSLGRYAAAGVTKAKLGMGIGFYAIGYQGGVTAPNQPTDGLGDIIVGGDNDYPLSLFFGANGAYDARYRRWDATARCSYLSFPAPAKPDNFGCRYVSFEDGPSIAAKGAFCRENGYGGIIVWTINQGYVPTVSNPYFLTQALRAAFIEPGGYAPAVAVSTFPAKTWAKPGKSVQFRAMVTGVADAAVKWKVLEPNGGFVSPAGLYVAPKKIAPEKRKTFHVMAVSVADDSQSDSSEVTVAGNIRWAPGLFVFNRSEWWMEVRCSDALAETITVQRGNAIRTTRRSGEISGAPIFSASLQMKEGEKVVFRARASDGRSVSTQPLKFKYGDKPVKCRLAPDAK